MKRVCSVFAVAISVISCQLFAQEGAVQPVAASDIQVPSVSQGENEILWLLGEVVTIDTENKAVMVYDLDQEKEIEIYVSDQTIYDNIEGFGQIKPKDSLSIDYVVSGDGKNIAKYISLQKDDAIGQAVSDISQDSLTPAEETPPAVQETPGSPAEKP